MIYLDNAATTKPHREILDVMKPYFKELWHNPSALYSESKRVKKDIEYARKNISDFINAKPEEIIFTSGASESNCTAITGFINYWKNRNYKPVVITSTIEHKSIMKCVENVADDYHFVKVDDLGFVDMFDLETILRVESQNENNKILVSIQFASNEIGTIQDVQSISKLTHKYGGVFHTDATQMFGHDNIDVDSFGIDLMSASGHKINAPKGIGLLYKRTGVEISPIIYGSQEGALRGGSENVPYIIALSKAVDIANRRMIKTGINTMRLRNSFIDKLKQNLGCKINGSMDYRLDNNISLTLKQNVTGEALLYVLDMSGICLSTGSACNSHSIEPSYVLKAIGLSDVDAFRTLRITIDETLTEEDIDKVINKIIKGIKMIEYENNLIERQKRYSI